MANCLYNGVLLPELPVLEYPYASLSVSIGGDEKPNYGALVISSVPLNIRYAAVWSYIATVDGKAFVYRLTSSDGTFATNTLAWEIESEKTYNAGDIVYSLTLAGKWWSNHDLYTTDGNLYLAASEPVPIVSVNLHGESFLKGLEIGRLLKARRFPVAQTPEPPVPEDPAAYYLYNGVRLPALPEWDKETYPYAAIVYAGKDTPISMCALMPSSPVYNSSENMLVWGESSPLIVFDPTGVSGSVYEEWTQVGTGVSLILESPSYVLWSNADILNATDSTVYLAASDPVPVYE